MIKFAVNVLASEPCPGKSSLRKPKVFALQILQRYLTKEGRVRKFFYCLYG